MDQEEVYYAVDYIERCTVRLITDRFHNIFARLRVGEAQIGIYHSRWTSVAAFPKGHRKHTPNKADHAYENEAKLWGYQGKIDYLRRGIHCPMRGTT